jgi:hypothetical protein
VSSRVLIATAVVAVAAAVILGARGGSSSPELPAGTETPPRTTTVGCRAGEFPAASTFTDRDLVVGTAAIIGFKTAIAEPDASFRPRQGRDRLWKLPVVLRPSGRLMLSIPREAAQHVRLSYRPSTRGATKVSDGDRTLLFESCRSGVSGGANTGWPGGFIVDGPRCRVPVAVSVGGAPPGRYAISFGSGCAPRVGR